MQYPGQENNYDVGVFNGNFLELSLGNRQLGEDLNAESDRAKAAEKANADALSDETERATAQETIIDNKYAAEAQAIRALIDAAYASANGYTDTKIADLINGAPSTLDTLGEIAQAMQDNADVVAALNEAIGKKASAAEFDSHTKDSTAHITAAERNSWNSKADKSLLAHYLSLNGGTMRGNIVTTYLEPAANRRYAIGAYSKMYSDIWAVSVNTENVLSPQGSDFLNLGSNNGPVYISPDAGDYVNIIVENITDGDGNVNGALCAGGKNYPEHKENWLGTPDCPWDNVFASKVNSKPVPSCSMSGTTLYINF